MTTKKNRQRKSGEAWSHQEEGHHNDKRDTNDEEVLGAPDVVLVVINLLCTVTGSLLGKLIML